MISALTGDGTQAILDHFAAKVPEGPWLYPEDQPSDLPLRILAAEITRESRAPPPARTTFPSTTTVLKAS